VHVGDHGNAARVMLERGVVQPYTDGRHSHLALQHLHEYPGSRR
jgi:hypothetical protein